MIMKQAVHFGAGNIGRGFIGALFSQSGYHVTFVDVADQIIQELNSKKSYDVYMAAEHQEVQHITNVSGINSKTDPEAVVEAIEKATYVTTAVGVSILPGIAPLIAKGITSRLEKTDEKLYVIACENQISATDILKEHVVKLLDPDTRTKMENQVIFMNCAVDRIVPAQHNEKLLDVLVEPYFEWVVETKDSIPEVTGMKIVSDIQPYIERKLFTVNTGHAVTAYIGYAEGKETIDQALEDTEIYQKVKATVEETGNYLIKRYGLNPSEHQQYIEKILGRFQNKYFKDDVRRVGRSPIRKLGPEDRLVRPAREAQKLGLPFTHLAQAIAYCLKFDVDTDPEAVELQKQLKEKGLQAVLQDICKLDHENPIAEEVTRFYKK
ncbi:Mannitol-1-phosphate 5-dehydrogenase [Heyndrickxia coagulans]|uniref:Mannitol-1-phosphate 5-dehydrogenase n=2 Tax=Heyndrickxia TaxID=2837504 RepID=A0AAN0T841_HEYCO|nr:hypothetical protein SB48_HM08orf06026 [Heyndrickxia coagulans]AKN53960.1 Mannitol-1-phosphate 5-dehydrogenase [Heyndrickxia coagulans]KYC91356.1 Mannitol-1-phosphate 5-dehydrogenase [Heyndrickxia coagulans]